jgi:hypothetical protein
MKSFSLNLKRVQILEKLLTKTLINDSESEMYILTLIVTRDPSENEVKRIRESVVSKSSRY